MILQGIRLQSVLRRRT